LIEKNSLINQGLKHLLQAAAFLPRTLVDMRPDQSENFSIKEETDIIDLFRFFPFKSLSVLLRRK